MKKRECWLFLLLILVLILFLSSCSTGQAFRTKILPAYDKSKCYDSDNGINLEQKGTTRGNYFGTVVSKIDFCDKTGKLVEFYCSKKKVQNVTKDCKALVADYVCKEGGCTPPVTKENVTITSNDFETNWTDKSANYDVYYADENPNIRIVCQQPCPIPEVILKKKTKGAYYAISNLLNLTKIDVLPILQPVDIHLTSDTECGNYQQILAQEGYVSASSGTRPEYIGGSFMCLWEGDKINLVLPLNEENAERIEAQSTLVHEYTHILFYTRSFVSPESFVYASQYYVAGFWDGNGLKLANFPQITNACDLNQIEFTLDVYKLCNYCGFQMEDVATLLKEIDQLYQDDKGEEEVPGFQKWRVSIPQIKSIIDKITQKDSVNDCKVEWLGEPCSNC